MQRSRVQLVLLLVLALIAPPLPPAPRAQAMSLGAGRSSRVPEAGRTQLAPLDSLHRSQTAQELRLILRMSC